MDQVKFVKIIKCLSRPYPFKLFKGCLPQILLGPFLNTLNQILPRFPWALGSIQKFISSTIFYIFSLVQYRRINCSTQYKNTRMRIFMGYRSLWFIILTLLKLSLEWKKFIYQSSNSYLKVNPHCQNMILKKKLSKICWVYFQHSTQKIR